MVAPYAKIQKTTRFRFATCAMDLNRGVNDAIVRIRKLARDASRVFFFFL
jgi:hypothetical protein